MTDVAQSRSPLEVFLSYAHKDEKFRAELSSHLASLKREGVIKDWHDRQISAGEEWADEIDVHINSARIILLLVSADFLASDYSYAIEMKRALERHEANQACVIPIILRPCDWTKAPFGKLQALPKNAKPVSKWGNRDEAFLSIVEGIRKVAERNYLNLDGSVSLPISRSQTDGQKLSELGTPKRDEAMVVPSPHDSGLSIALSSPAATEDTERPRQPQVPANDDSGYDTMTARYDEYRDGREIVELTLDSRRARTKVVGRSTQGRLVDEMVRIAAPSNSTDVLIRRSLYELLVPVEIEPFLSGSTPIVLQLDKTTAGWPWELVDSGGENLPWAVRTKVLRKLLTPGGRVDPGSAMREGGALVIGEPQCDMTKFPALPGARAEAQYVAKALGVQPLIAPDALQVVNNLLAKPLRIVHISGHAEFRDDGSGGVVLSNDNVLGPREIAAMRQVPELVFVNCCFIGEIDPGPAVQLNQPGRSRVIFAASFAEALISIGVRCVIAAGWAVEDGPAVQFAVRFFERVQAGDRFVDAVGAARLAAWEARPSGNTWAAFQCYGDPDWRYLPA